MYLFKETFRICNIGGTGSETTDSNLGCVIKVFSITRNIHASVLGKTGAELCMTLVLKEKSSLRSMKLMSNFYQPQE